MAAPLESPEFVRFESIDSTSLYAQRLIATGAPPARPTVYVARQQTGGIGRLGRRWHSPPGGIWLTLLLPAEAAPPPLLALAAGLRCAEFVDALLGHPPPSPPRAHIRWPNDLMLDGLKVGGILVESRVGPSPVMARFTLIGLGLNLNLHLADLPPGVPATSVGIVLGAPLNTATAEAGIVSALMAAAADIERGSPGLLPRLRARQFGVGQTHPTTFPDGRRVPVTVRGLTDAGALLAEVDGQERTIESSLTYDAP